MRFVYWLCLKSKIQCVIRQKAWKLALANTVALILKEIKQNDDTRAELCLIITSTPNHKVHRCNILNHMTYFIHSPDSFWNAKPIIKSITVTQRCLLSYLLWLFIHHVYVVYPKISVVSLKSLCFSYKTQDKKCFLLKSRRD